ncbi:hypothetical protein ACFQVC_08540 [Streptomyces monticola]|uniref:Potassium transporter TrkA n=1 Tax=Streptomyces monticola TaxID=2666263 RepID=A0ABW2JEK6_9ACTN
MPSLPQPAQSPESQHPSADAHMVVCGDDALAERLAAELAQVYRERVTLVIPSPADSRRATARTHVRQPGRASALFGRVTSVMGVRTAGNSPDADGPDADPGDGIRVLQAAEPDDDALAEADTDNR